MKTKILIIVALLFMYGCGASKSFFVLSTVESPITKYTTKYRAIGVEKITLPEYLFKREIAIAKSSSQISFLSGVWAEDLDTGLTNRVVGFLQKKFNIPNVHTYPWGSDNQPNIKVQIQISRFIAQDDSVELYANWSIENLKSGKTKSKLFNTKVATDKKEVNIVASMDRAFKALEEDIAKGIRGF